MSRKPKIDSARIRQAPERVGAAIKHRRELAGITAEQLGAQVGVSTVNQFQRERGLRDLKLTDLLRYAQALGVAPQTLLRS